MENQNEVFKPIIGSYYEFANDEDFEDSIVDKFGGKLSYNSEYTCQGIVDESWKYMRPIQGTVLLVTEC